jgi:hypothetical protein
LGAPAGARRGEGGTHNTSIYERILEIGIPSQKLPLQERCIRDVAIQSDVDGVGWREVLELHRLKE